MRYSIIALIIAVGCVRGDAPAAQKPVQGTSTKPPIASPAAAPVSGSLRKLQSDPAPIIRGLYISRFASHSKTKMARLIGVADSTEINAFVIDVKDEFGLNYHSSDPMVAKNEGRAAVIGNMRALIDTLRAHGILPIARIVVFKDSVTARLNPNNTIRKPDGTPWRDKQGLTWVNPYANSIWEYNFRVAEEAIRMGFGEIQFDYIRFPEPYKSLPPQVFPEQNGRSKTAALAEFLQSANKRLDKLGVRTTADVFGLVTTVNGALEVGQAWEPLAKSVDVLLPMTYPSHYPHGSFGVERPNAEPYKIMYAAVLRARQRNEAIGLKGETVRPWIQAFSLGPPKYGPAEIEAQKKAIYDAGYDGWVLWEPGSRYDIFRPAFEPTLVTRKKTTQSAAPASAGN